MAASPSWIGRLPAALLAIAASLHGILTFVAYAAMAWAVFAGYRLMLQGRVAGGLLQFAGIGGLTVEFLRFGLRLRDIIAASPSPGPPPSMTGAWEFAGIVLLLLVWGIVETARCRKIAARHPLAESAVRRRASRWRTITTLGYPRLKRASLTALLGIAIMIPALGLTGWLYAHLEEVITRYSTSALIVGGLAYFVLMYESGRWSQRLFFKARRMAAMPADDALRLDRRPASLLLRSFTDDLKPLAPGYYIGKDYAANTILLRPEQLTLEEVIAEVLSDFGPVIAIGRPGEALPPVGASREYVPSDQWEDTVSTHMREARWIAVVLGTTEGLEVEFRKIREHSHIHKVILVFPPVGAPELEKRWQAFTAAAFDGAASNDVSQVLVATIPDGRRPTFIACKERDAHCYEFALRRAVGIHLRAAGVSPAA